MRAVTVAVLTTLSLVACGGEDKAAEPANPRTAAQEEPEEDPLTICEPDHDGRIEVRARFKTGETRSLEITKTRTQDGAENESKSTARLEVLGPRRLRWTSEEVALPEGVNLPEDTRQRLEQVTEGLVMEYSVDRDGGFQRVENVDEVRAVIRRMMDFLLEEAGGDERTRRALEQARELTESDAFIQASVSQDVAVMHAAYGYELKEGKQLSLPYQLPNPFGGEPLPARARVSYGGNDRLGCAQVSMYIKPDGRAAQRAIEKGLAAAGAGGGRLPDVKLSNVAEFAYDAETGWVTRAEGIKDISVGGRKRSDRIVVTLAKR